jgi:hypothetical protein
VATTVRAKHTVLEYLLVGKVLENCQWLQQDYERYERGLFLGAHNVKDIKGFNVLNAPPKKTATLFMVLFRNILYLCSNIWSTFRTCFAGWEKSGNFLQVIAQRVRKPYATYYGRGLLSSFCDYGFSRAFPTEMKDSWNTL